MSRYIPRDKYLRDLRPFIGNGNAKVLVGIRRSGKSTLLSIFSNELDENTNVVYINTELAEYAEISWRELLERINSAWDGTKNNVLIMDEVQNIGGWELAVRDLIARDRFDIYITGSNANLLSSEYATHLGGRFNKIPVQTLCYTECKKFGSEFGLGSDVLDRYLRIGGFPLIWTSDLSEDSCMSVISDITETILSKDIVQRFNVRNQRLLRNIYRTVLSKIGSYVSSNSICNTLRSTGFRTTVDTVNEYLGYLETAGLLLRAEVYDIKGKRTLDSKRKYYAADLGLKHAELGYRPEDVPGHLENVLFRELKFRGYNTYVGDVGGKEIDLVAEKGGRKVYVQACTGIANDKTMEREFGNLESIRDSFPKYVVMTEPGPNKGITGTGIVCCSLKDFLELPALGVGPSERAGSHFRTSGRRSRGGQPLVHNRPLRTAPKRRSGRTNVMAATLVINSLQSEISKTQQYQYDSDDHRDGKIIEVPRHDSLYD